MNLRTKLWLMVIVASFTGLVLFVASLVIMGSFTARGYTHESLNRIGNELAEEAGKQDMEPDREQIKTRIQTLLDRTQNEYPQMSLEWFSKDGTLQYATDQRKEAYTFDEMMERFVGMPGKLWGFDNELATLVFHWALDNEPQYLIMSMPSKEMRGTQAFVYVRQSWMLLTLLIPLGIFFITPIIFSLLFFTRINRRLKTLNRAVQDFDARRTKIVLDDRGNDEIIQLNRHLNHMSERILDQVAQIQDNERKRQTLIANLSHDLRTPLTMIQGYAETLHDGLYQDDKEMRAYAEIVLRRSRYMNELLQKLLEISHMDMYSARIHLKQTNLSEQLRKLAADYIALLENHGMSFEIEIPEQSILVMIDPPLIERAVRNLVENAIQYGRTGGYLGLSLRQVIFAKSSDRSEGLDSRKDYEVEISVTDKGPGIPVEKQELIFERFTRGSDAREGEGLGIGLSIVKDVASIHKGSVRLESKPDVHTIFTLVIPHFLTGNHP
ncbi:sensor histidine kinase [Paenibacillus oceani]|uniref:histidine kinase n=1 Tax=Paenibacillus oceani TaxID=2772510 RepID=A0A927GZH1_9BACL|nr:HAMP domain-containing sensor histidine kinase [Paenibacillus oceani]MBD2862233.1 HAMP domain-containing histidine kinase [Paenibacillus oceani]